MITLIKATTLFSLMDAPRPLYCAVHDIILNIYAGERR